MVRQRVTRWRFLPLLGAMALGVAGCAGDPQGGPAAGGMRTGEAGQYASLMRIGASTRAAGDLAGAAGMYRRAIAVAPDNPEPLVALGDALNELKAYNEAAGVFQSALKLQPGNTAALRGLANALLALDQPALAAAKLETALRIDPQDHRLYNSLGVVLDLNGDHAAAQSRYRTGLELQPGNLALQNNLGLSLALAGRYDEAASVLRPLAAHPGASVRNRQNLALVYGLSGDLDMAARVSRMDLDEAAVRSNLTYYGVLRSLADGARTRAIGADPSRFQPTRTATDIQP